MGAQVSSSTSSKEKEAVSGRVVFVLKAENNNLVLRENVAHIQHFCCYEAYLQTESVCTWEKSFWFPTVNKTK